VILIMKIVAAAVLVLLLGFRAKHDLHMLQQNSYRNDRYWRWLKGRRKLEFISADLLLIIPLAAAFWDTFQFWLILIVVCALLTSIIRRPRADKKPLVMTARAKRLWLMTLILAAVFVVAIIILQSLFLPLFAAYLLLAVLIIFSRWLVLLANRLIEPVEKKINNGFYQEAQAKLASMPDTMTFAITGSYGKTSCKMILAAMLSEKYLTLATPSSYNTPMGITRVIREQLRPIHQAFVCEMGARQKGDISELCRLVKPRIGILTSIGEQHLETFGNIENIIATKFELIKELSPDGLAVLNMDNLYIAAYAHLASCQVIGFGIKNKDGYYATDIKYDAKGSSFVINTPDGASQQFTTRLLGKHNIYNILAAAAAANQFGLPLNLASNAVKLLEPIEHRLQLRCNPVYTVIDDAFNSNPAGAATALEVLSSFSSGCKIIITPGMVELGEREYQLNKKFALQMAQVCDFIILVGKKHSQPLQDGLTEAGYEQAKYFVAADLKEAQQKLQAIVQTGDIVLYENDLPDTYNE